MNNYGMRPDKAGVWEWFDEDGTKRLVSVCDVGVPKHPHLRVYWWGGYYNTHDELDPEHPEYDEHNKAEWADRWGKYIGPEDSVPDDQKYWLPTPEKRTKIFEIDAHRTATPE